MARIVSLSSLLLVAACFVEGGEGSDVLGDAPEVADAAGDVTAGETAGLRCCPSGACDPGWVCLEGACHQAPGADGCYVDGECGPGEICDGGVRCPCGAEDCTPTVGECRYPDGCCQGDEDCDDDRICHEGVCRAPPADAGACWTDERCGAGQACEGIGSCPCGVEGCDATPGFCAQPGACCLGDRECGPEGRCLAQRCVPDPGPGGCFGDEDCPASDRCVGPSVCPCGDGSCRIPTTPGACVSEGEEPCCEDVADCAGGEVCVEGRACLPIAEEDGCYVDGHCGAGRVCDDATVCGCGDDCLPDASTEGTCRTVVETCGGDGDCGPGMRCVVPDRAYCPGEDDPTEGVCVEDVDEGCWSKDDCAADERCGAERICTTPGGCAQPNRPGTCRDPARMDNCCDSHRECGPGFECRNSNTTVTCPPASTATCVPKPQFGETCWSFEDCSEGFVCHDARMGSCNALFGSRTGFCEPPDGQPCMTGFDCGGGYTCARDEECPIVPTECGTGGNCPIAGTCYPDQAGACWSHSDCGDDAYCKGLRVCPADEECQDNDLPGACTPLGVSGDCCDSYHGCEAGFRCISAAGQSACGLGPSSVCVPRVDDSDEATCYIDADCGPARICEGAEVCPCGLSNCEGDPVAGSCVLK